MAGESGALYTYISSPIGTLFVAATDQGVARLGFEHEITAISALRNDVGEPVLEVTQFPNTAAGGHLERAAKELQSYFAGDLRTFTVPTDLRVGGFRGRVTTHLATIAYGDRRTYGHIAQELDNPGAVRAVGSACARNPIPIFLPCHRVVRSDGTWGQYRGGEAAKTYLLELEEGN